MEDFQASASSYLRRHPFFQPTVPNPCVSTCGSVRRASGFVLTGKSKVVPRFRRFRPPYLVEELEVKSLSISTTAADLNGAIWSLVGRGQRSSND
jgi:hypothetical protein